MKVQFDGYEVEIKAKSSYREGSKYNTEDTEAVLNHIVYALIEAAKFNEGQGYKATALSLQEEGFSILDQLEERLI